MICAQGRFILKPTFNQEQESIGYFNAQNSFKKQMQPSTVGHAKRGRVRPERLQKQKQISKG